MEKKLADLVKKAEEIRKGSDYKFREGQAHVIALMDDAPYDFYVVCASSDLPTDPFYDDSKLPAFFEALKERGWE